AGGGGGGGGGGGAGWGRGEGAPRSPAAPSTTPAASSPAPPGRRRAHRRQRSNRPGGRAWIGSCFRNRSRSAASSPAVGERFPASFRQHFRQMVSRSRGPRGVNPDRGTASSAHTSERVSAPASPLNSGPPV